MRVNSDFYLRSNSPSAYHGLVAADQVDSMVGKWVQTRTGDPRVKSLSDFTSLPTITGWAQGVSSTDRALQTL